MISSGSLQVNPKVLDGVPFSRKCSSTAPQPRDVVLHIFYPTFDVSRDLHSMAAVPKCPFGASVLFYENDTN